MSSIYFQFELKTKNGLGLLILILWVLPHLDPADQLSPASADQLGPHKWQCIQVTSVNPASHQPNQNLQIGIKAV